jgi:hypothetical protein
MAILDDLKGILSPEDFAKINGNAAIKTKLEKGDELYGYYAGADDPPPAAHQDDPPPARRDTPPPAFDLGGIERMLDKRLEKIGETIEAKVADVVKSRGDELVNNAVKISLQRADELNRVYSRHEKETGKPFDSADFNAYLEKPEIKARGFRTITEAYEAYVAPVVLEKKLADAHDAGVKEGSGKHVPGTTPAPSTNSNIRFFKQRSAAGGDGRETGAQRAAALLDQKMNSERSA